MAKLYFRYGVVGSAKTLNLLAVAHNYKQQGKKVVLLKPAIDTRFGADIIGTRAGLSSKADIIVPDSGEFELTNDELRPIACLLVDEVQFLAVRAVEKLHAVAHHPAGGIPVICYGLRSDFRLQLFPASQRLFELADTIEEVKTTCTDCTRKAVFNLKLQNNRPELDGPTIELGCEEKYLPVCANCYQLRHSKYMAQQKKESNLRGCSGA